MKLVDIASTGPSLASREILIASIDREEAHPELRELLRARGAMIAACEALNYDERKLANSVLALLDMDTSYMPSESVLRFVRSIVATLNHCQQSKGWII